MGKSLYGYDIRKDNSMSEENRREEKFNQENVTEDHGNEEDMDMENELSQEEIEAEKLTQKLIEEFEPAQLTISVKITPADMYYFLMRHAYGSISGWIGVAISIGAIVLLIMGGGDTQMKQLLLIILALMFTVINPVMLYSKAVQQVKLTPMFQKEILYSFGPSGIMVEQEDEKAPIPWESVYKVVRSKKRIIIYMSKMRAFVIPVISLGESRQQLDELLEKHLDSKILK